MKKKKRRVLNRVKVPRSSKSLELGSRGRTRTLWLITLAKGGNPEGKNGYGKVGGEGSGT
jgi:hypothetical protein